MEPMKLEPCEISLIVQVSAALKPSSPDYSSAVNGNLDSSVSVVNGKTYALIQIAGACISNYFDTGLTGCSVLLQTNMFHVMGEGSEWATGRLSIVKATSTSIMWKAGTNPSQKRQFAVIRLD